MLNLKYVIILLYTFCMQQGKVIANEPVENPIFEIIDPIYEVFELEVEESIKDGVFQFGEQILLTFSIRNVSNKEVRNHPGRPYLVEGEKCLEFSPPWNQWNEEKGERDRWQFEQVPPGAVWKVQWDLIVHYCFEEATIKIGYGHNNKRLFKTTYPNNEFKISRFFSSNTSPVVNPKIASYEFTPLFENELNALKLSLTSNISESHSYLSEIAQLELVKLARVDNIIDSARTKDIAYAKFLTTYIEKQMPLLITKVPQLFRKTEAMPIIMYHASHKEPIAMFLLAQHFDRYSLSDIVRFYDKHNQKDNVVQELLNEAANLKFTPALTALAERKMAKNQELNRTDIDLLKKAGSLGDSRGYLYLAEYLYSNRDKFNHTNEDIINYYDLAFDGGSVDAYYYLFQSELKNTGTKIFQNLDDLILLLEKAANQGHSWSMNKLGELIIENHKEYAKAFDLFQASAESGNSEGMYLLGLLYSNAELPFYDFEKAFDWIKKSAINGSSLGASLLSVLYQNPETKVDSIEAEVLSRYWHRIAVDRGIKLGSLDRNMSFDGFNFLLRNFSIKDRYRTYDYGHSGERSNIQAEKYQDIIADGMDGVIKLWIENRKPSPDKINDCSKAYEKNGVEYYAVTLNDKVSTNIFLNEGDDLYIKVNGKILASLNSTIEVDYKGTDAMFLQSYNRVKDFPHACLMFRTGESKWSKKSPYVDHYGATSNGELEIAVNDRDPINNRGYFDVQLIIVKR